MNNYVLLKITGKDVKRFVISLYKKGINFYKIKYDYKSVYLKVNYKDYLKILNIKTIYEIKTVKIYGLIKLKYFLNKYKTFVISIITSILFLYFLSNLIFDIEIINEKKEIRDLVRLELKKYDIKKYNLVKGFFENEEINDKILKNNKDKLEWMEIERIGNKYIVRVEERKYTKEDNNELYQNIVAKKKGIITKIEAKNGEIVKKTNDYVLPGDVIITGIIKNKDTLKDVIKAEGKVFAEVWYNIKVEIPLHYQEIKETGKTSNVFRYNFLNYHSKNKYNKSIFKNIFEIKNNLLPIEYGLYKEKEINTLDIINTPDKAIDFSITKARMELSKKLGKEDKIIYEKCLKIVEKNSTIIIDIFLKTNENISKVETINLEEIKKQSEKEEQR